MKILRIVLLILLALLILIGSNTSVLGQSKIDPVVEVRMSQIDAANEVYIRYRGALEEITINERIIAEQMDQFDAMLQVNLKSADQIMLQEDIKNELKKVINSHEDENKKLKKKLFWHKVGIGVTVILFGIALGS